MLKGVDGALLVGPVFRNDIHNEVTDDREPGSPFWRPVYKDGENVRFAVDALRPRAACDREWEQPRVVYLQNATDPITYWKFDLLWKRPEWLDDPRGPDVSDAHVLGAVRHVLADRGRHGVLDRVPAGHGHDYGVNPVDAWAAIYPPGWTAEKTERLRAIVGND